MTHLVGKKTKIFWVRYRSIQPREAKAHFKSWLQKCHCPLNYLVLTSTITWLCSRNWRDGRPKGSEKWFSVRGYHYPSPTPYLQPLLMAQGTEAAKGMHWSWAAPAHSPACGPTTGLQCSSWGPHMFSAQQRGQKSWTCRVISEILPLLTCKIDHSSRKIALSSWGRRNSLKIATCHEGALRSHTWDVHHEVLLQSKQPRKSNWSNMWVASCRLLFLAFILSWRFP